MNLLPNILLYLAAFVAIWYGADLIVRSVIHFSHKLRISSFSVSFFLLGLLTSLPEFALGLTSVNSRNPEIFVGNLIGGVIVIFLFVVPIFAIIGKSIKITHDLDHFSLIFTLIVTAVPSLVILDHRVTTTESFLLILLYFSLFYVIESRRNFLSSNPNALTQKRTYSLKHLLLLLLGVLIVFVSSHYIVTQTLIFSSLLHIPAFIISILFLSFGTNLPEMSLAVKSITSGHKEVAFGNYLGSAAANTFLFGFFSFINQGEVITTNDFLINFIFVISGLGLFYIFSKSKNTLSRTEGSILLILYLAYIGYWLITA